MLVYQWLWQPKNTIWDPPVTLSASTGIKVTKPAASHRNQHSAMAKRCLEKSTTSTNAWFKMFIHKNPTGKLWPKNLWLHDVAWCCMMLHDVAWCCKLVPFDQQLLCPPWEPLETAAKMSGSWVPAMMPANENMKRKRMTKVGISRGCFLGL